MFQAVPGKLVYTLSRSLLPTIVLIAVLNGAVFTGYQSSLVTEQVMVPCHLALQRATTLM